MAIATSTALLLGGGAAVGAAALDRKSATESVKSAQRQRDESQAFIEKNINQARGDLFRLFPQAQESRRLGAQAGLDLIAQTVPQQLGAFQQGNIGAQDITAAGFRQQLNAVLGQPIQTDFQPVRIDTDFQVPDLPPAQLIGGQ